MLAMMKETMSAQGLRTLGFSYKDMSEEDFDALKEETNDFFDEGSADQLAADHTFVCFVAMKDPLRDQVKKAMRRAKRAQLNVRIVTNNSLETSVAQAIDCGLLPKDYMSMDNKTTLGYAMEAAELRDACGGLKQV
jgi:magnesium-transporting ATPase (P-type)